MSLKMRGKKVGIEKLKKSSKKGDTSFLVIPDSDEYLGIVRYVGEEAAKDIQVGQRVYFANQYQSVKMAGADICVMDDVNVLAVVNDEKEETTQA